VFEDDNVLDRNSVLQYWAGSDHQALPNEPLPNDPPENPPPHLVLPVPDSGNGDVQALIHDITAYAGHLNELGPEATAGLVFHVHKKLQDSLLSQHTHPIPASAAVPGLMPSPVIMCPNTGECSCDLCNPGLCEVAI
jgi:hypothetical protein